MAIAKFGVEVLGWHSWNCVVWCEREREGEGEEERKREREGERGERNNGKIYKNNTTCVRQSPECTEKCGHFEHIFGIHNIST